MKLRNNYIPTILFLIFIASSIGLIWMLNDISAKLSSSLELDIDKVNRRTNIIIQTPFLMAIFQIFIALIMFIVLFFKSNSSKNILDGEMFSEDLSTEIKKINLEKKVNEELQSDDFRFEEHIVSIIPSITSLSLGEFSEKIIIEMAKKLEVSQANFYIAKNNRLDFISGYAFHKPDNKGLSYTFGEGLAGQVAKAQQTVNISDIPKGYIKVISGLGEASPTNLLIVPLLHENETIGVMEFASFKKLSKYTIKSIERVCQEIAKNIISKL